jgi:transposase-like protein
MSQMSPFVPRMQNEQLERRLASLPIRQQKAVLALANGQGVVRTARAIGVDRRTIYRWTRSKKFRDLRSELRRRVMRPLLSGTVFDVDAAAESGIP